MCAVRVCFACVLRVCAVRVCSVLFIRVVQRLSPVPDTAAARLAESLALAVAEAQRTQVAVALTR